jgi:chorismate mutase
MESSFIPIDKWGFPLRSVFIAAGPCSAESREQVMETARGLKDSGISFLRAGIWKPRTYPGTFEGAGIEGLKWLTEARDEFKMAIGVEVANPEHVEICLDYKVDVLWIGARTTPNPFAIQAIADALKGTDMPVLIKNPISPDIDLWLGAIERMQNVGLKKIGAIHRGFSTSKKVLYRYAPNWKIPIELKRRLPEVPLLCDPSHICGKTELIYSVAQEALDLLFDGLMIEVHNNPSVALSDSRQQLTPDEFHTILKRLTMRHEMSDSDEYQTRIKELRLEVDDVDDHLIKLLGKRMDIARQMGALKRRHNISTLQPKRWEEILESRVNAGKEDKLSEECVFQIFQSIHEEAIRQQEEESS